MTKSDLKMSRRVFIRLAGLQLVALTSHWTLGRMKNPGTAQAATHVGGYGSGKYDEGKYPGYQVFIPLILRGGN